MDLTKQQKRWIIRGLVVVLLVGYVLALDIAKAYMCATDDNTASYALQHPAVALWLQWWRPLGGSPP
jgi:hypothetical protein